MRNGSENENWSLQFNKSHEKASSYSIFVSCILCSLKVNQSFGCDLYSIFFMALKMIQRNHIFIRNTNINV